MAILNRDLDPSLQRDVYTWTSQFSSGGVTFGTSYVGTGITLYLAGPIPYPYIIQSVNAMCIGSSGTPQLIFAILRPIPGGMTTLPISISNLVIANGQSFLAFGASGTPGYLGYSGLAPTGSTLLLGQRGDVLIASTAVANTAVNNLMISMVVQKVQDIITLHGV